jgi:hypothetical protein
MDFDVARARRVFELYDAGGSGTIDANEIHAIFTVLGEHTTQYHRSRTSNAALATIVASSAGVGFSPT